jgi:ubiquinone/menaquinone biosynthesis C-methylase UbiE
MTSYSDGGGTRVSAEGDGAYFDRLVEEKGDFNPFADRGWNTLHKRFVAVSADRRAMRVVDVGCGTGRSLSIYEAQAGIYLGMDLSFGSLRVACTRHQDRGWVQGDALKLPIRDASVDVVAFSSVLHHVPDPSVALAAAMCALRPGGLVFAFDPNLLHPAMMLFRHPRSPLYRAEGVSPDEQPLRPIVLKRAFAAAGLAGIGQRCQSDIPYRAVAPKLLNSLLPVYNILDRVWEVIGAGRRFGTFVITWGWKPIVSETRPEAATCADPLGRDSRAATAVSRGSNRE